MAKIEWKGGECPVHPDAKVNIWLRNGAEYSGEDAGSWSWKCYDHTVDIIAYEVIEAEDNPEKTLRDEFAIAYLQSGNEDTGRNMRALANDAYLFADEMMKARAK